MTSSNIELVEAVKVIASVLLGFVFTAWLVLPMRPGLAIALLAAYGAVFYRCFDPGRKRSNYPPNYPPSGIRSFVIARPTGDEASGLDR